MGAGCGHVPVQPVEVPAHCTAPTWARFTAKIVPVPGCHFWVGALADGRTVWASRFPVDRAPRPAGTALVVMRMICDGPSCTRLDHLRAGSQTENLVSAASRDRSAGGGTPAGPTDVGWPVRSRPSGPPW